VTYWRALLKLDPNSPAAVRESMTMLDGYLASTPAGTHRFEAGVLRRHTGQHRVAELEAVS
jgi:hypothetical protein